MIGALLVKFSSGFQPTGAVQEGYSDDMVEAGLIGTAALVGIFGLFIVMGEVGAKAARSMLEQKVAAPVRSVAAWVQATACCRKCRRRAAALRTAAPGWRSGSATARSVADDDAPKVTQWAAAASPHNAQTTATTVTPLHNAHGDSDSASAAVRSAQNAAVPSREDAVVAGATNITAAV